MIYLKDARFCIDCEVIYDNIEGSLKCPKCDKSEGVKLATWMNRREKTMPDTIIRGPKDFIDYEALKTWVNRIREHVRMIEMTKHIEIHTVDIRACLNELDDMEVKAIRRFEDEQG